MQGESHPIHLPSRVKFRATWIPSHFILFSISFTGMSDAGSCIDAISGHCTEDPHVSSMRMARETILRAEERRYSLMSDKHGFACINLNQ